MTTAGAAGVILLVVLALDVMAAAVFLLNHALQSRRDRLRERARALVSACAARGPSVRCVAFLKRHRWVFLREAAAFADAVEAEEGQKKELASAIERARVDVTLARDLRSRRRYRRIRAAVFFPLVPSDAARWLLTRALESEGSSSVKLFLAAALSELGEDYSIPTLIDSMAGESERYQRRLWGLLSEYGEDFAGLFPVLAPRQEKEIQLLLIDFGRRYRSVEFRDYLLSRLESEDFEVTHAAFHALCEGYPGSLDYSRFLSHDDVDIRRMAAESLGNFPTAQSLRTLFEHLDDGLIRRTVVLSLTAIIRNRPQHFRTLMMRCLNENEGPARSTLVTVLAGFTEYLLAKLATADAPLAERLLVEIICQGRTSDIVNFLNRNAVAEVESRALAILREGMRRAPGVIPSLRQFLNPRLLAGLSLEPSTPPSAQRARAEHPNLALLRVFLVVGAGLIPAVCAASAILGSGSSSAVIDVRRFLQEFNATFAIYAAALNGLYLFLLAFSFLGAVRQASASELMRLSFLFKENVLPSISIISPAYNEEASIVESVSSLLTLRYPDYEVIVVNDGSRDRTLEKLISYFELERKDLFFDRYLATQPIRALYASKRYPELIVVDKENGGKADSLNAGINVARKEYFAGIDADSMLEHDALLSLTGLFLHTEDQVVAAGGNILPINGCAVRRGALLETRIPRAMLPRFQTIEYLRAFMAGRVGWATLKSLLIISGAFGVFHRRRVIDAHGYLTRSEHYMKDTVGEDMELVVRLTRGLRENRTPFAIQYGYNANCWTEIPETMRVLNRQRDRWQRGLLDIVTFHSRIIFNPRYGRTGMIGFPYFLIFEVLGPWFEAEGFVVLLASLALGMVRLPLFLLLFTATIGLGLLVSTLSLVLAELRRRYFPLKDKLILLLFAFLESFGFRQLMSILRVRGFLRMLARVVGWGQMERRGLGAGTGAGR
jgi:cellulose synthase/poly-beta-1,6-N-acetylglucosamine synthase-like glycosyltransferase